MLPKGEIQRGERSAFQVQDSGLQPFKKKLPHYQQKSVVSKSGEPVPIQEFAAD